MPAAKKKAPAKAVRAPAQRIHKLIPGCRYHDPVVSLEEWDKLFNVVPYPKVSDLQGERIAPVWLNFIKETNT